MAQGNIRVTNTEGADLFVTIKDLNTINNDVLWNGERLNEDDSTQLVCEIDGSGEANLDWYAERTSDPNTSHTQTDTVDENDELEVFAS